MKPATSMAWWAFGGFAAGFLLAFATSGGRGGGNGDGGAATGSRIGEASGGGESDSTARTPLAPHGEVGISTLVGTGPVYVSEEVFARYARTRGWKNLVVWSPKIRINSALAEGLGIPQETVPRVQTILDDVLRQFRERDLEQRRVTEAEGTVAVEVPADPAFREQVLGSLHSRIAELTGPEVADTAVPFFEMSLAKPTSGFALRPKRFTMTPLDNGKVRVVIKIGDEAATAYDAYSSMPLAWKHIASFPEAPGS